MKRPIGANERTIRGSSQTCLFVVSDGKHQTPWPPPSAGSPSPRAGLAHVWESMEHDLGGGGAAKDCQLALGHGQHRHVDAWCLQGALPAVSRCGTPTSNMLPTHSSFGPWATQARDAWCLQGTLPAASRCGTPTSAMLPMHWRGLRAVDAGSMPSRCPAGAPRRDPGAAPLPRRGSGRRGAAPRTLLPAGAAATLPGAGPAHGGLGSIFALDILCQELGVEEELSAVLRPASLGRL